MTPSPGSYGLRHQWQFLRESGAWIREANGPAHVYVFTVARRYTSMRHVVGHRLCDDTWNNFEDTRDYVVEPRPAERCPGCRAIVERAMGVAA